MESKGRVLHRAQLGIEEAMEENMFGDLGCDSAGTYEHQEPALFVAPKVLLEWPKVTCSGAESGEECCLAQGSVDWGKIGPGWGEGYRA